MMVQTYKCEIGRIIGIIIRVGLFRKMRIFVVVFVVLWLCAQADFIYQGQHTLQFAPIRIESINGELIFSTEDTLYQMKPKSNFYNRKLSLIDSFFMTDKSLILQKQSDMAITVFPSTITASNQYKNKGDEFVIEKGIYFDQTACYVPLSEGSVSIGVMDYGGMFNVKLLDDKGYFQFGSLVKIGETQIGMGTREHIYIIDKDSFKVNQKIQLNEPILNQYQIEYTVMDQIEYIRIYSGQTYQAFIRRDVGHFQYHQTFRVNTLRNTVLTVRQDISYVLSPTCELLKWDFTLGDNYGISKDYLIDGNIAVSGSNKLFLQSSGVIQQLNFQDGYSLKIVYSFKEFQGRVVNGGYFMKQDSQVLVLTERSIQKYILAKQQFDAKIVDKVDKITISNDQKLIFSVTNSDNAVTLTVLEYSSFNVVVSKDFTYDKTISSITNIYSIFNPESLVLNIYQILAEVTIDGITKLIALSFNNNNKKIQIISEGFQIKAGYQIIKTKTTTVVASFKGVDLLVLELLTWKGQVLMRHVNERIPSFMKGKDGLLMVVFADGISDYYSVQDQLIYMGSQFRYRDGSEASTILLPKQYLVYIFNKSGIFYQLNIQQLPISKKIQLSTDICRSDITTTKIFQPSNQPNTLMLIGLNIKNQQISLTTINTLSDQLNYKYLQTSNQYKITASSVIKYNPINDMLLFNVVSNNTKGNCSLIGVKLMEQDHILNWDWSYSLDQIDDFAFNGHGDVVIEGETNGGNLYQLQTKTRKMQGIKADQIIAVARQGQKVLVRKTATEYSLVQLSDGTQEYKLTLKTSFNALAISQDGSIIISTTKDNILGQCYIKGQFYALFNFQQEVIYIAFTSSQYFFIQTVTSIVFFQLKREDNQKISFGRLASHVKLGAVKHSFNSTHIVFQQNNLILVFTNRGNLLYQLSLPTSSHTTDISLSSTGNIYISTGLLLQTWSTGSCSKHHINDQGVCKCPSNSQLKGQQCVCNRGYYFQVSSCLGCGILCDECDENGCISYNIALFASGVMFVLLILAMVRYVVVMVRNGGEIKKDSLLSEAEYMGSAISQ